MQKWEYKVIDADDEFDHGGKIGRFETEKVIEGLNKLGEDGWELISVRYDDDGMIHRALFKRPIVVAYDAYDLQGKPL